MVRLENTGDKLKMVKKDINKKIFTQEKRDKKRKTDYILGFRHSLKQYGNINSYICDTFWHHNNTAVCHLLVQIYNRKSALLQQRF